MIEAVPDLLTETVKTAIKASMASFVSALPSKMTYLYNMYFKNFEHIFEVNYLTCSRVKTIVKKDLPVELEKIYVRAQYKSDNVIYNDDDISEKIRNNEKVIVTGFGGIGKTVFLKHLWLVFFHNPHGKLPIFFELRNTNDAPDIDLLSHIRLSLNFESKVVPTEVFTGLLSEGRLAFLLDGFDEINDQNRANIERQIQLIARRYPKCAIIVSSRQDNRFYSWQDFQHFAVMKFNKAQATEVIEKAMFDQKTKADFKREILDRRFQNYEEFFATPLLTLMMLLTYQQVRNLPENPHEFYKYAFQTLYTLHDSYKGFTRKRYVDLSEAQFIRVFSIFCLVTYSKSDSQFDKQGLISYLDRIKPRVDFDFDTENFLQEALECVNLLYYEGNQIVFVHRTFQEYYCAYAATHFFPDKFSEIVERIPVRYTDSVYNMIVSINKDIFEKMYVIKKYETFKSEIERALRIDVPSEFLKEIECEVLIAQHKRGTKSSGNFYTISASFREDIKSFFERLALAYPKEVSADKRNGLDLDNYFEEEKAQEFSIDKLDFGVRKKSKVYSRSSISVNYTKSAVEKVEHYFIDRDGGVEIETTNEGLNDSAVEAILLNGPVAEYVCQQIKSSYVALQKIALEVNKRNRLTDRIDVDILEL